MNISRAQQWMDNCSIDAIIATSPVNVTYFSDYHVWLDAVFKPYMINPGDPGARNPNYAIATQSGESALVVEQYHEVNAAETRVDRLYVYGDQKKIEPLAQQPLTKRDAALDCPYQRAAYCMPTAIAALTESLGTMGLQEAKLGVELENLSNDQQDAIRAAFPRAQIKDCTNLIRLIRMVKTVEEIERLRVAAQIAEDAGAAALQLASAGCKIQSIIEGFRSLVAEAGADFEHFCFTIGGYGLATEPNYQLTTNDLLQVDWGCIYRHYFSDTGTTLMTRPPTGSVNHYFQAVCQSIEDGFQHLRPGVKASQVQIAMIETLAAFGVTGQFPHGHGMGLEIRDYPILVPDNGLHIRDECVDVPSDLLLEKDMVVNLESNILLPDYGAWHSEQTFLVTGSGAALLIPQSRDEPIVCG